MPGEVDIVIVNWNAGDLLRRCVQSIASYGGCRVAQVIIVDNGSTDGSADLAVENVPLDIVKVGRNLGFGRACNLGAARGSSPYLLFFNPDAELGAGTLDQALGYLQGPDGDQVGVCGIRLVDVDGHAHRHCARFPTARTFLGNSLGLTRALKRWFPPVLMVDFDHLADRRVDHVMGAFYLMPRRIFEQVGGFDEDFFVYLEDLDLSRRVRQAGYRIEYRAGPAAFHKQGGTSEKVKAHRLFYSLKSNVVYVAKHLGPVSAAAVIGITYLVEPVSRTVRGLLRASPEEVWFTWRGFAMLYRDAPATLRTVREIVKRRLAGH